MKSIFSGMSAASTLAILLAGGVIELQEPLHRPIVSRKCGPHEVAVGPICMDAYEATVWRVPDPDTSNASLVRKIRSGRASRIDLALGGASRIGLGVDDYAPCADNGDLCAGDIFAVSLPSEIPSGWATWFQAQEACANSGKRLPTNAEWQAGASGTPDPGVDDGTQDCTIEGDRLSPTGERTRCVSARGAFDMVGNVAEWAADWVAAPSICTGWAGFSDDAMCLAGASTDHPAPGALVRGGAFAGLGGAGAGPFSIVAFPPFRSTIFVGFRCVR
jgi:hypothetical protein